MSLKKYSLKPNEKVKTVPTETSVLSSKDEVIFDLLFQRLVILANGCNISFDNCKGHEMIACPQRSLNQQLFKAEKPLLTTAITHFVSNTPVICEEAGQVIFDGSSIFHLDLWEKNIRLQDKGLKYTSYIISRNFI